MLQENACFKPKVIMRETVKLLKTMGKGIRVCGCKSRLFRRREKENGQRRDYRKRRQTINTGSVGAKLRGAPGQRPREASKQAELGS